MILIFLSQEIFTCNFPFIINDRSPNISESILQLEVFDNRIGKLGFTHGTGFGSQLISLLTRQLSGKMREEIKNGTRIFFDFKLDKVA